MPLSLCSTKAVWCTLSAQLIARYQPNVCIFGRYLAYILSTYPRIEINWFQTRLECNKGYRKCWLSTSTTSVLSLWGTLSQYPRNAAWRWFYELCDVIVLDKLLLFIKEKSSMHLEYSHNVFKKSENVNGAISERRYPINTNTILWQLLFPWDDSQTCLQIKRNKSTTKFGTITSFQSPNQYR